MRQIHRLNVLLILGICFLLAFPLPFPSGAASSITVHYHRPDGDYDGWRLWTWGGGESVELQSERTDDFGIVFEIDITKYNDDNRIGILPKYLNWEAKDDPDRFWTPNLGYDVFILSADKSIYVQRPDVSPRVLKAMVDKEDEVRLVLSKAVSKDEVTADRVGVQDAGGTSYTIKRVSAESWVKGKSKMVRAFLDGPIPLEKIAGGQATFGDYRAGPLVPGKILDKFSTDEPLGAIYSPTQTIFRAFAPEAIGVSVLLWTQPAGGDPSTHPMERKSAGIWEATIPEDLANKYYLYKTKFADGEREVMDPYSRSNTATRGRCLIVSDATAVAPPPDFPEKDAIIYELHLRDFTIDPASGVPDQFKGKYLGLAREGTRYADDESILTGIDHLKELGVNVIQILPFQDFDNDETQDGYNWGYMPFHFFSPEGWFATRRDDATRVKEVKQMVDALHRNGMKVVMDVVYNHTAEGNAGVQLCFNGLAPNYYYRTHEDGSYWNGSGCGNEFRSESAMGRKYIVDSVKYWVEEYGVDGFRFDLMGLIDIETMKSVVREVKKIKPDALIYGEPWAGGNTPIDKTEKGDQRGNGFSVFNDHFRDAIKGSTFSKDPGFAQSGRDIDKIKRGIKGSIDDFAKDPVESINYVEAHDNHTLWDRLAVTSGSAGRPSADREKMDKLSAALVLTSQGIPFLHAGQEMLRTKQGEDNSYNKPDHINQIHWVWKKDNSEVYEYYKRLIALRRNHPMFRQSSAEDVRRTIFFLDDDLALRVPSGCVGYVLNRGNTRDDWANALLLFNGNGRDVEFTVPGAGWNRALAPDESAVVESASGKGTVKVPAWSAAIFFNTDESFYAAHLKPAIESRKSRVQKFSVKAPGASRVAIAGSFNGWKTDQYFLQKQPDGSWSIDLEVGPGSYEYKFLQDGDWDKLNKDNRKITVK